MPSYEIINRSSGTERNDTIELLRIIAIAGVIWFHFDNVPWRQVGYSGLVFFLTTSVIFQKKSAERATGAGFFLKRAARLLIPWAAWFLIYGLYNLIIGKRLFPYSTGFLQNILTGPWIGLWYLPFSFLSACFVYLMLRNKVVGNSFVRFVIFSLIALLSLVLVSLFRASGSWVPPWSQWLQAAPSLPIGLAMAYALADLKTAFRRLIVLQGGIVLTCAGLFSTDTGMALSYGIGSLLVTIGLAARRKLPAAMTSLGSLCLGVYLVHGLVMSGFKLFPCVTQNYFLWFILTTTISFIATAVIKRIPFIKVIV